MSWAFVVAAGVARADSAADCDRLAAAPENGRGVSLAEIDPAAATAACGLAVAEHPGEPRFLFQYGRALQRAGDGDAAARLYGWAAADGFAPAQHALGLLLQPSDPAASERWLAEAAAQGYAPPSDAHAEDVSVPEPGPAGDPDDALTLADSLADMADVLEAIPAEQPRDRFDPLAVLQSEGPSVEAITAWVAREVVLVPYRGSLRGARGTLLDRHGNSLDRALLLAELLATAGHEVRLARASLDLATAATLAAAAPLPVAPDTPPGDGDAATGALIAAAGDFGDVFAKAFHEAADEAEAQAAQVAAQTDALAPVLLAALADVPRQPDPPSAAVFADHWWVQVRDGDRWLDADPSAVATGLTPAQTLPVAELPAELRHQVVLRLVVEFWEEGRLREETVLEHGVAPADLVGRPVLLRHVPMGVASTDDLLTGGDVVAAALDAASAAWIWQPVLVIDNEAGLDRLYTMRGEVLPAGPESLRELGVDDRLFGDLAEQIGSVFDEEPATASAPPDEATATVRVSAEWLEIEVRTPGEPPAVHRRSVFDLLPAGARGQMPVPPPALGPAERLQRALALLRDIDVLVTGAMPQATAVRARLADDAAALLRTVESLLRSGEAENLIRLENVPRLQLPLSRYALLRTVGSSGGYLDQPNVILAWSGFSGSGPDDLRVSLLIDIVANALAPSPAAGDAFAARVGQGVRDTVAEAAVAGAEAVGNAAVLHAADLAAGRPWLRIDGPAALAQIALPAEAEAAIAAALAEGAVVLAPPSPVATDQGAQVAWWRIDPATGSTLGMSLLGGAAMTERAMLLAQGVEVGGCFVALGMALSGGYGGLAVGSAVCIAGGVTAAVAIIDGAALPAMIAASITLGGVVGGVTSTW